MAIKISKSKYNTQVFEFFSTCYWQNNQVEADLSIFDLILPAHIGELDLKESIMMRNKANIEKL